MPTLQQVMQSITRRSRCRSLQITHRRPNWRASTLLSSLCRTFEVQGRDVLLFPLLSTSKPGIFRLALVCPLPQPQPQPLPLPLLLHHLHLHPVALTLLSFPNLVTPLD